MIIDYFGINGTITCIVTLFLAEYCGFGWVVGTFFWVFCFCFGIAWTTKFKHWGVHSAAKRLRPRRASLFSGATSAASRRSEPPNVSILSSKRFRKKTKYQKKVPTISQIHNISQKNVTIYIIFFFCVVCIIFVFFRFKVRFWKNRDIWQNITKTKKYQPRYFPFFCMLYWVHI